MFFKIGFLEISNINRKTSVLESLLNKIAGRKAWIFNTCFLVNIVKLFDNKPPVAFRRVEICST